MWQCDTVNIQYSMLFVCKIPLLARRTRPSVARDDRVSCIQVCNIQCATIERFVFFASRSETFADYIFFQSVPCLYTRYTIVVRALGLSAAFVQPLGRARARAKLSCIQVPCIVTATFRGLNSLMVLLLNTISIN